MAPLLGTLKVGWSPSMMPFISISICYCSKILSVMMTKCAFSQLIPTPFVKGNVAISHLIFVDDAIIFSRSTPYATYNLKRVLEDFHCLSELCVNWNKIFIIFSCCDGETRTMIKGVLNVNEGSFPFQYLEIPMSSRRLSHHDCILVLKKFKARPIG